MIRNAQGDDIAPLLTHVAEIEDVPLVLALACVIAESGLDPRAERWGRETVAAKAAAEAEDWGALQAIIYRQWPDISFGYGQQIVLYHYAGNRSATTANCLEVRTVTFQHPTRNLRDMCLRLHSNLDHAQGRDLAEVDGDINLAALVIYNAGSLKATGNPWWRAWASNVTNYRRALLQAAQLIAAHEVEAVEAVEPEPEPAKERDPNMTNIDDRAGEASIAGQLGDALSKERGVSGVKIKAFEHAILIDIPGAGVYVLAEATVARKFDPNP